MTETFTASNGVRVTERDEHITVRTEHGTTNYMGPGIFGTAIKEYIDHIRAHVLDERDKELGRWRWPENQEIVVHAYTRDDIAVVDERTADVRRYERAEVEAILEIGGRSDYLRAARAYFDAHPEPKPAWHDAKDGEIWEFTVGRDPRGVGQYLHEDGRFFRLPLLTPADDGWGPAAFASDFTRGTRVWPRADS